MKLNFQQLTQHITKQLAPFYIISGDDIYLTQEIIEYIRSIAIQRGFTERIPIIIESGTTDWGNLFYLQANNLSLFAEKRLIELDLTQIKLNALSSKVLQPYVQNPPANTLLLIRAQKLDSQAEKSAWYKVLNQVGMIIPVWPITREQLPDWIMQKAKKFDLNVTKSAAELLANRVEGNLLAAHQALEKLTLLNASIIDQEMMADMVADNTQWDVFSLVESVLAGNQHRSSHILQSLAAINTEPTLILWALTRECRIMAEMSHKLSQGVAMATLFSQFRIFEKRQPSVRVFLKKHQQKDCWEFLLLAAQIDRIIKGAETGNIWDALSHLVLSMSGML